MWKTGPPTSKDLPEVLQWGNGASIGPEAGSGLEVLLDRASATSGCGHLHSGKGGLKELYKPFS